MRASLKGESTVTARPTWLHSLAPQQSTIGIESSRDCRMMASCYAEIRFQVPRSGVAKTKSAEYCVAVGRMLLIGRNASCLSNPRNNLFSCGLSADIGRELSSHNMHNAPNSSVYSPWLGRTPPLPSRSNECLAQHTTRGTQASIPAFRIWHFTGP